MKKSDMKRGNVIVFETKHPSSSWNNGLFIVLELRKDDTISMCKLDKKGQPQLFPDGRFMETITGCKNNPNLFPTKLTYALPKTLKK